MNVVVKHLTPAIVALLLTPLATLHAAQRPNFLFVYTDDQRYDAMGVVEREQGGKARWPWIQTPNMDRLAREGVRFRNAFVVNSLCAPSRASFLTGCYGYVNGVVNNHTEFPVNNVTYATLLRQAGYRTGYVGKWHMGKQSGQRPGFDYSARFIGQGRYTDCPFEINGKLTPTEGWVDDVSAEFAVKFLRENRDKPFMLAVGFKSPHGPCTPPPRLANFYGEQQARTVPNLGIPAIYLGAADYGTAQPTPPGLIATKMDYHRSIHGADENLGRLLDELDKLGLTDNTMVIFTSDNGYYVGEHRLGDKRSAYEESMRVPMLVRYPKLANKGKAIGFQVPPFADDPKKSEQPLLHKKECVLDYRFELDASVDKVEDRSGKGNHGTAEGVPLVEGRAGHKVRRFDGQGFISVPKSPSLAPVSETWTVDATFKSDKPNGIILAHGGATNGYCLYLKGGKPAFTVNSSGHASTVVAERPLPPGWRIV